MNWGNKLVLVFVAFAALMGTLVYKCMNQNFELVSKDYYGDELRYQDKIEGMNNANRVSDVTINNGVEQVSIQLPKELKGLVVEGEAWFYCSSNSANDRKLPITTNEEGVFIVEKSKLAKAAYTVKLTWKVGEDKYHSEQLLALK